MYDLSYPRTNSVNTFITKENSEVHHDSIDWIINLVQSYGKHYLMTTTDIEDVFRIISISLND